eukprot:7424683-Alexandrium_andersonii.AAC.1
MRLPFRSWCPHCVPGRMPNAPRSRVLHGQHNVPEVAMGYCFLTTDGSDMTLPVLVSKDCNSRAILAHPVLCKGRVREDTVDQAVASIHRLGHQGRVLLKRTMSPPWWTSALGWQRSWGSRRSRRPRPRMSRSPTARSRMRSRSSRG